MKINNISRWLSRDQLRQLARSGPHTLDTAWSSFTAVTALQHVHTSQVTDAGEL